MTVSAKHVSIIIPALNEEGAIFRVVQSLISEFSDIEVIVIDDGSIDQTGTLAEKAGARVLRHDMNRGYGAALRTGIEAANREYVLFCDADGQHTPEDVGRVIAASGELKCDMVVGARTQDSHAPVLRRPGKFILKIFANYLADRKIPDLNSGLRIIRRDVIRRYLHLMPQGFSFSTTSTFALLKSGHSVQYIPITVLKRVGQSTVRQWKHGPQTILLMLRLTVLFEPLRVFLTASGLLLALMFGSATIDLLSDSQSGIGDTTVLFAVATLQVFLFGLLCEQISSVRREQHNQ